MKNNISVELPEKDRQEVLGALRLLNEKLPFLVSLTEDERQSIPKMGSKSVDFVQDNLLAAKEHPDVCPGNFSVEEFERDMRLIPFMQQVQIIVNELNKKVDDTLMALGSDLMHEALQVYSYVGISAQHNPALKPTYEKLKQRFAAQGRRKGKSGEGKGDSK